MNTNPYTMATRYEFNDKICAEVLVTRLIRLDEKFSLKTTKDGWYSFTSKSQRAIAQCETSSKCTTPERFRKIEA